MREEVRVFLVVFLTLLGIIGLSLIGFGITGKIVLDETVKDMCSFDANCSNEDVCCLFYNESAGICHSSDMCGLVKNITKQERLTREDILSRVSVASPTNNKYVYSIISGLIITVSVGVILYFIRTRFDQEKDDKK